MPDSEKNRLQTPKDSIEAALAEADIAIKRERTQRIGKLLDKAAGVLLDIMDTDDEENAHYRIRAAEMAINLYTVDQENIRADKQLELQEKKLAIEAKKVGINTLFLQQNNYGELPQTKETPKTLVRQEDGSIVDVDLLARKKAQQMLLDAQLGIIAESVLSSKHDGDADEEN